MRGPGTATSRSQCEQRCTCVSRAHEEAFRQWETGLQTTRPPIILPQECVTRRLDAAMDIQDLRRNADPDSEDPTDTAGVFMQTGHGRGSDMHDDPSTQELAPEAEPRAPPQPPRWSCNECGVRLVPGDGGHTCVSCRQLSTAEACIADSQLKPCTSAKYRVLPRSTVVVSLISTRFRRSKERCMRAV